jgi:UDPglucose--hexose-1-phosphate uridylyltransferase
MTTTDRDAPTTTGSTGAGVTVTRRPMADGRELLYFDDGGHAVVHDGIDHRDLGAAAEAGTMRLDVLTGEWVTIAAHRMTRTHLPSRADCPLCPTRDGGHPTEVPEGDYDVVVFGNRFPSFSGDAELDPGVPEPRAGLPDRPALGRCEVVCFSSDHSASVSELTRRRMRTVVAAWAQRTAELSATPGVEQVFCFENRGEEIGVTLAHPHGQIYAYPYVTPRTAAVLTQARAHARRTGGHLLRDVLHHEQRAGTRMVLAGEHWSAYVPTAARWPVEVHLAPHRDVPDLAALDAPERDELADVYQELLRRVDRFFPGVDRVPYIAAWHQAPVGEGRELARLHLQVFSVLRAPGKLKYLAGSESGMGAWVNDASPETIAARLREVAS